MASVQIRTLQSSSELAGIRPDWDRLISLSKTASPFQTWEWLSSWWRHFEEGRLWVLVAEDEGEVIGIMPLIITTGSRSSLKTVRWMGYKVSDYQDAIMLPECEEEGLIGFLNYLWEHRDEWDLCDLQHIQEGSMILSVFKKSFKGKCELSDSGVCPVLVLPTTFDDYLLQFKHSKRWRLLHLKKKIEKHFPIEIGIVEDNLPEAMQRLFELHNTHWQLRGQPGKYSSDQICNFHQEAAEKFLDRGWLRLYYLKANGQVQALFYFLQFHSHMYFYLSGYEPSLSAYSPGSLMLCHAIEEAIKNNAKVFDFLRGNEPYKYYWHAKDRRLCGLLLSHPSWRSYLALLLKRYRKGH